MSPTVVDFTYIFCPDPEVVFEYSLSEDIDLIATSMPRLSRLSLAMGSYLDGETDALFGQLCTRLPDLRAVVFPTFTLSPATFRCLLDLPSLHTITLNRDHNCPFSGWGGDRDAVDGWRLPLSTHITRRSLPSLTTLALCLPDLSVAHSLLQPHHLHLHLLRHLELVFAYPETCSSQDIQDFLRGIAEHSAGLVWLSLEFIKDCRTPVDLRGVTSIGFCILEPVLTLSALEHFGFHHTLPLDISDADADLMARRLPNIITLHLNHYPIRVTRSPLSMRAVESFARWCPRIQTLGIYIDGSRRVLIDASVSFAKGFRVLNLGSSYFPVLGGHSIWSRLGLHLLLLLPLGSTIYAGPRTEIPELYVFVQTGDEWDENLGQHRPVALTRFEDGWKSMVSEELRYYIRLMMEEDYSLRELLAEPCGREDMDG